MSLPCTAFALAALDILVLTAASLDRPMLRGGADCNAPSGFCRNQQTFVASDGMNIGFISVSKPRVVQDSTTLLIAPGLSGTAAGFIDWFAQPLLLDAGSVQQVVAMDWRGYGLSSGLWGPDAPPDGPTAPSYQGISTWRLAQDLKELITILRRSGRQGKVVLLSHSMGVNVVLQLLELHGALVADGLVLLDDSPKNMALSGGVVADATFPSELVTFTPDMLQAWLPRFMAFNKSVEVDHHWVKMNLSELSNQWQPYYDLDAAVLEQFHAADESVEDNRTSFMTQTTQGLLSWMHYFGPSNGKVMALLMVSSMQQDVTGVAAQVREARVPFFWYGGEQSLLKLEAIVWSAQAMSPCDHNENHTLDLRFGSLTSFCPDSQSMSAFELLQFNGTAGVHCPWLNEDGSADVFMDAVKGFLSRL